MIWKYIICGIIGYLVCNINISVMLAKRKGIDIRAVGSNNPGASNVFLSVSRKTGVLTALIDIVKAAAVVFAAGMIFNDVPYIEYVTGLGCCIGNLFPYFHKFKGGKGLATLIGMTLGIDWLFCVLLVVSIAIITLITRYIAIGTLFSIITYPIYTLIMQDSIIPVLLILFVSVLMFIKHIENIKRLRDKKEIKLSFPSKK